MQGSRQAWPSVSCTEGWQKFFSNKGQPGWPCPLGRLYRPLAWALTEAGVKADRHPVARWRLGWGQGGSEGQICLVRISSFEAQGVWLVSAPIPVLPHHPGYHPQLLVSVTTFPLVPSIL